MMARDSYRATLVALFRLLPVAMALFWIECTSIGFNTVDAGSWSSNSVNTFSIPRTSDSRWLIIRGGGDEEKNGDAEDEDQDAEVDTTSDNQVVDTDSTPTATSEDENVLTEHRKMEKDSTEDQSSRSGPFRMLQEIREEATALAQSIANVDQESGDEKEISSTLPNRSSRTVVGGAAVATKQKTKRPKAQEPRLVDAPAAMGVDTSRVAPMASRLIQEDSDFEMSEDEQNEEADESSLSQAHMKDIAKLWWVNLRQQLAEIDVIPEPDGTEDEEEDLVQEEEPSSSLESAEELAVELDERQDEEPAEVKLPEVVVVEPTDEEQDEEQSVEDTAKEDTLVPIPEEVLTAPLEGEQKAHGSTEAGSFVSSGLWGPIDNILTFGIASKVPSLRISRQLRSVRKLSARVTGLHGLVSGKPYTKKNIGAPSDVTDSETRTGSTMNGLLGYRTAAIDKIRKDVEGLSQGTGRRIKRRRFGFGWKEVEVKTEAERTEEMLAAERKRREEEAELRRKRAEEAAEEARRMTRVREIDRLISEGQSRLQQLICEKDVLQRRPNPLFNYTATEVNASEETEEEPDSIRIEASRTFNFPSDALVEEYLEMTFSTRRIAKMNHSQLWQDVETDDDEEESIGEDLFTPSANAHRLYDIERQENAKNGKNGKGKNGSGGSWLLRQSIGKGPSFGEKIGEVAETAAYKAVCKAVMAFLARMLSSLHGVNVMKHSDIRLVLEQAPDLPRVGAGLIPGLSPDYAQDAIKKIMKRKTKKGSKQKYQALDDSFVQRDAVTEMLLSHVQISAPLLKLFPLAWQRAFLGNIITLCTAIMADFCEGLQFQILGHSLTFAFAPITEEDMLNHLGLSGAGFNHRRAHAEEFEAAVRETAEDVGEGLKFLDRWHERALGSGVLRTQIANLIARIVLTLVDEVLGGARMDLWSAQAGGPRLLAGLEHRTAIPTVDES